MRIRVRARVRVGVRVRVRVRVGVGARGWVRAGHGPQRDPGLPRRH